MAITVGSSVSPSAIAEAAFGAEYNTKRKGYIQNRQAGSIPASRQTTMQRQGAAGDNAVSPLATAATSASSKLQSGIVDQQLAYGKQQATNADMEARRKKYTEDYNDWTQRPYIGEGSITPAPNPADYGLATPGVKGVPSSRASSGGRGGGGAGRSGITEEYSAKQRADFNQRHQAIADAEKSGRFTPEEINDMYRQQAALDAGLKPIAKMNPPKQYPDGQGIGNTWSDPTGKFMLTRNRYGDVQSKPIKPEVTIQDRIKANESALALTSKGANGEDPKDTRPFAVVRDELLGINASPMDALVQEGQPSEQDMVDQGWMPATGGAQDQTLGAGGGANVPLAPAMPEIGAEVQGFRFMGGDPSQQENWEQL